MRVSVVIPAYNEEKYIKKCLDTLTAQTVKPDEIILVDNNCTDNTVALVRKYSSVKVIKETEQGMIPARNAGFNTSQGDIIAKCDADSILPSGWIKNIKNNFSENQSVVGISMPVIMYDLPVGRRIAHFLFYFYMFLPRLVMGIWPMTGPGYAIRKSAWDQAKSEVCLDDKKVHEDIDLTFHLKKIGVIIHDSKTVILGSARRIKSRPLSFFGEYTLRFFRMLKNH
jgi:glycosyltransferase involved in cell wall biosynthesis